MKNFIFLAFLGALLLGQTACKRSVEGETQSWEANKGNIQKLSAKYSNFKPAFEEILKKAEAKMSEAQGLNDEKAKISAMSEANSIIRPKFVRGLEGMDRKISTLEDLMAKAAQQSKDHSDRDAAWAAKSSGDRAIREARELIRSAKVSSAAVADGIVSDAERQLASAQKRLQEVVKVAKEKAEADKQAQADEKAAETAKEEAEEKKASPIKCAHCGNMNKPGSLKCSSCTAPLEQNK